MSSQKVLFIYTNKSSFIKSDIDILSEKYTVYEYRIKNRTPLILLISLIKSLFFLLANLYKYKVIYIWFADYHSYIPILIGKILKKKTLLVVGGYDVCREKKYHYGSFINPIRGYMALYSINNASRSLAVSKNIERIVNKIAPSSNCSVIYNGVDLSPQNRVTIENQNVKKTGVLCVSLVNSKQSFYIKGVDRYISAARILGDVEFTLIGAEKEFILSIEKNIPTNLQIVGKVNHSNMANYYSRAKVYCQFSRRESFCLALAEAMIYNCSPVIANVGGMPEVTAQTGIIVSDYSPESLSIAISKALSEEDQKELYSNRIKSNFLKENRKQKLLQILEQ